MGQQHGVGGGRIETNCIWYEAFSVENCNEKNMQEYLGNNIKFDIRKILCVFLLGCLAIRYKFSLFYKTQPCELHKSRQ